YNRHGPPPALHSFPTRRSSDLLWFCRGLGLRFIAPRRDAGAVDRPRLAARHVQSTSCRADRHPDRTGIPASLPPFTEPRFLRNLDRKSARLNSSHVAISYAVFC